MPLHTTITTDPPAFPPLLRCPSCDARLQYVRSYLAGTRLHPEQWDDYVCSRCGRFEYRQRTRKLHRGAENVYAEQTQQRRRTSGTD